jgi:transcription antitermination factor NusG
VRTGTVPNRTHRLLVTEYQVSHLLTTGKSVALNTRADWHVSCYLSGGGQEVPLPLEKAIAMPSQSGNAYSCLPAASDRDSQTVEAGSQEWYALAVKPRHDKAVSRTLEGKGYQTLIPLYKQRRRYATRSKETTLPLFPGYVFCRFNCLTRLPVLTTPGVIQILGAGRVPTPVDETEIASLQTALQLRLSAQPVPFLHTGQKVRITAGALAGVEGIILGFKQCLRLVLSVTLLRRSVLLEIDRDYVDPEHLNMSETFNVRHETN